MYLRRSISICLVVITLHVADRHELVFPHLSSVSNVLSSLATVCVCLLLIFDTNTLVAAVLVDVTFFVGYVTAKTT